MSDTVKLIIEIDEESYKEIKKIVSDGNDMFFTDKLIANGIPFDSFHDGEYINKEELTQRMLGHINRFAEEKNFSMNEGLKYAQGVIVGMPTFFVPEREKGEWIKMGGFMLGPTYKCSNCGIRVVIEYGKKYKCCPNCEANMRMGKEGDNL